MSTWKPGATITVRGRVSQIIWQHIMTGVEGKKSAYFDLDGEKSQQTVVYWKDPPTCNGTIEVTGKVLEVRGGSKRPGGATKVDESYSELQIDVEHARCVD